MFKWKRDVPKVEGFGPFLDPFTPENPKLLPKTRIFPETTSLWLSSNLRIRNKNSKIHFRGKNGLFKIENRSVNKNQEGRGQFRITFSEASNSGLTIAQKIFVVARLKLALFKFWCHFFPFKPPFLTEGQFLGVTPNQ